jgi:hypothetical protein
MRHFICFLRHNEASDSLKNKCFNFSEVILGEFGDFSFALVGRMFFATAFCTFLTCIGAQYLSACLDPHPSCSLSIEDARALAGGVKTSLYTGHVAYRCRARFPPSLHSELAVFFVTVGLQGVSSGAHRCGCIFEMVQMQF